MHKFVSNFDLSTPSYWEKMQGYVTLKMNKCKLLNVTKHMFK